MTVDIRAEIANVNWARAQKHLARKVGRSNADDVLQDSFVRLVEAAGKIDFKRALHLAICRFHERGRYRKTTGLPPDESGLMGLTMDIGPAIIDHCDAYGDNAEIRNLLAVS